jgi:Flp pilus assembly pilin Flp
VRPRGKAAADGHRACDADRVAEHGQALSEYALIIAGLAIVLVVSLLFLGGKIGDVFTNKAAPQPGIMSPPAASCDPSYTGACIPPPPPDLDCSDLRAMGVGQVSVVGSDPHNLDPDHDGIACD